MVLALFHELRMSYIDSMCFEIVGDVVVVFGNALQQFGNAARGSLPLEPSRGLGNPTVVSRVLHQSHNA
jgi:hypothetical protein